MALKKKISINGQQYNDAYFKIESVWFEAKQQMEASSSTVISVYPSRADSAYYDRCIHKVLAKFQYDLSSSLNVWTQAYEGAKQHPEIAGAEDVFES